MAKVVIAGKSDCPYYARVELLGDKLTLNLPDFKLHKIVLQPQEWEKWLKDTCDQRGWEHKKSPLVWRELIDRGGKGVLIGGANEFQEYVFGYYGVESQHTSGDMKKMAAENQAYKIEEVKEEKEYKAQSHPLHVCITNATNPVCYSMINAIAKGDIFGPATEVALHLYDSNDKKEMLQGIQMEAEDLAYGLLRDTQITSDIKQAFKGCDAIVLLDEIEQKEKESRDDWIKRNSNHFVNYAKVINEVSKKDVKVILAGKGPINLNVYMMIQNAPNISKRNFVGMSRMLENHAKAVVAERLNINSSGVVDLVIWGNVNGENYIDISKARVHGYDGAIWGPPSFSLPATEMIWDKTWLTGEFIELVKARQSKVEELLKHPASMSQGAAITTMLQHWWNGSPTGQIFSLAVVSEGFYDVSDDLVCSLPVVLQPNGQWDLVQDFELTKEMKDKIQATIKDIIADKNVIFPPPKPPTPPPSEVKVTIIDPKDQGEKKDDEGKDTGGDTDGANEPKLETIIEEKTSESITVSNESQKEPSTTE